MDPISIATLVLSLVTPYIQKIAGKLAEKAAEALPDAAGKVWDMVKEKLEAQPETKSLPADLAKTPDDPMVQGAFQYQLKKLLENDEAFAKRLEEMVKDAKQVTTTTYSATLEGDGAIAQGNGATAVGKGGVYIGGNASDNMIITSDNNIVNSDRKKKK